VSFISNNLTIICMGMYVAIKKLIIRAKIFRSLQNIQRSKLAKIIVVDARFNKTF
jgi:hypothetical protein